MNRKNLITNHWTGPRVTQPPFSSAVARPVSSNVRLINKKMKKTSFLIVTLMLLIGTISCSTKDMVSESPEIVMHEGMEILVKNQTGEIKILAGKGYERFYTWEGQTRSQILIPRKKRWAGKFGIGSGNASFEPHNTISKANLAEEQLHFISVEEAVSFLNHRSRQDGNTIYNDEGLMVTWKKAIHPKKTVGNVLIVTVYQAYINGNKPTKLPYSKNDKITINHKH